MGAGSGKKVSHRNMGCGCQSSASFSSPILTLLPSLYPLSTLQAVSQMGVARKGREDGKKECEKDGVQLFLVSGALVGRTEGVGFMVLS